MIVEAGSTCRKLAENLQKKCAKMCKNVQAKDFF